MDFLGRKHELNLLNELKQKNTASLVCVMGRRRIGKSTLIAEYGRSFKKKITIQGLGPDEASTKRDQLDHFSKRLSEQLNKRPEYFLDWTSAFTYLSSVTQKGEVLILFDEISWMGRGDPLFAAKIKDAWDTQLKNNPKLILVLCGSVSSWIQENILLSTNFEGRVSLVLNLKELSFHEINQFLAPTCNKMGSYEILQILSATGGVPKYLEEVLQSKTAEQNIIRMSFQENGLLFNDFEKIFKLILGRRSIKSEKIIRACLEKRLTPTELAKKMKLPLNGAFTQTLEVLELSGFLSRDNIFDPYGNQSRKSILRVKDNYLRFYLKVIEPLKPFILKGGRRISSLSEIPAWNSIAGFQFENLILQNKTLLLPKLNLTEQQIISSAPYIQFNSKTQKHECQIDLLIHTDLDVFYMCEIKFQKRIDTEVITEVENKSKKLKLPKRSSLKFILICEGEMSYKTETKLKEFFYKIIKFEDLL